MYGRQCNDIISNIVFIRMFFTLFSNRMISFFTLQCELFTSCNVLNNASLLSTRTGGVGVVNQMWTGLDRGRGVPKIPKFVGTSFMDDPKVNKTDIKRCKSSIFIADLFAWNTFWLIFILVSIIHAINIAIIFCIIRKCSKKLIHYFLPLD